MDKLSGYKTVLFNLATLALTDERLINAIPPKWAPTILVTGNLFLRLFFTKGPSPVGEKIKEIVSPNHPMGILLLCGILALMSPVDASAQTQVFSAPQNTIARPTATITTATVTTTNFSTAGMGSLVVQFKFGTVTGTYTTCTVQAATTIDNVNNYLTIGSAISVTVTTGTTNSWLISAPGATTVSSTVANAFGQRTRFVFACSGAYGTSAPVVIVALGFPGTGGSGSGGGGAITSTDGAISTLGTTTDDKNCNYDVTALTIESGLKCLSYLMQTATGPTTGANANSVVMAYPTLKNGQTAAITNTTSTQVIAGVASNYLHIGLCVFSNTDADTDTEVALQDGSGGTTLITVPVPHNTSGVVVPFSIPLKVPTSGNGLFAAPLTTGSTTKIGCTGYATTIND